jgi:hypothetical protein
MENSEKKELFQGVSEERFYREAKDFWLNFA